jgi:hypothetical protein
MRPLYLAFISLAVIRFDAALAESERKWRQRRLGHSPNKTPLKITPTPAPTRRPTPAPTRRPTPAPTPAPVTSPGPANLTVGVFYYPWHTNNFHNGDGFLREKLIVSNGICSFVCCVLVFFTYVPGLLSSFSFGVHSCLQPPQLPALGKYNDQDKAVIRQHLQWCMDSKIFLWVMSWWGPTARNTETTKIMLDYMESQTSNSSFPIKNFRTAVFYETLEHIPQIGSTGRYNTSLVKGHIEFMADNYFMRPNCFKIDGKPVIFVYLTRVLYAAPNHTTLLSEVINLMRQGAKGKGYDIYIVGDHAYDDPSTLPASYPPFQLMQAVVNYDVFGSMRRPLYANDTTVLAYKTKQQGWKDKANAQSCGFIPSITPGFNKAGKNPNLTYGPMSRRLNNKDAKEGTLFEALLKNALGLVDNKVKVLVVNSFNEYHEDTQIEPIGPGPMPTNQPLNLTRGLTYEAYDRTYLNLIRDLVK